MDRSIRYQKLTHYPPPGNYNIISIRVGSHDTTFAWNYNIILIRLGSHDTTFCIQLCFSPFLGKTKNWMSEPQFLIFGWKNWIM